VPREDRRAFVVQPALVCHGTKRIQLDPLLFIPAVRQESLLGAITSSSAAAYGLMQIIPCTGEEVAAKLGLTDFTEADLGPTVTSVQTGAAYLGQ
jgi:soluble lytic murein transglycosylase